jgi:hypothetical protein
MIDIHSEQLLSLGQAARRLPGHPALSTLWRWQIKGVLGVRLETVLVGGRRYTSVEALSRFVESSNRVQEPPCGAVPRTRTAREREAAIRRAERELREMGV